MQADDGVVGGVFKLCVLMAGIFGAAGVIAAAGASHAEGSRNLSAIATIGLAHGPALLAIGLAGRGRMFAAAAALLAVGTTLFIGDLGWREWQGSALFPGAAPAGGIGMVLGWLCVAAAGLAQRR